GALRRRAPGLHQAVDLGARERARRRRALVGGDRGGRDQFPGFPLVGHRIDILDRERPAAFPGAREACLAARVAELDARLRPAVMDQFANATNALDVLVAPQPEIAERPAALARDLGRFHADEARAACRV